MGEAGLAVEPQRDNPSGNAHFRLGGFQRGSVSLAVFFQELGRGCRPIKPVGIGVMPARLDLGKLFLALEELVDWFKR